ncbi:MAG: hypothetical protein A2126_03250 [Candidatus Woykebacteria bacterium GWB1_45_5]|uniref:SprT-like domain-containing protein n=2 Tax=Microgenomates group TaxID=1794810 RepID=A0A0G1MVG1_9BACT|nr:MAG: hypothetical protein UX19_C0004G0013 [Candidatus Woesebacteria bacterium GW2011_GWA1_45_8]OGY22766.1 MAG: hypothetical protein A2126_03250 [Candidatus Woykebacteria bacterium GWB1_45_5]
MRDDTYLANRLNCLWAKYFSDVPKKEDVKIHFGRKALYRFGSIKFCFTDKTVRVTINGRFQDKKYPREIIDHTIAHELVHYAQGFPTPGPALHRYPHRGGVIDKELEARGLSRLTGFYKDWAKDYIKNL